jgi:hypothetical protein
VIGLTDFTWLSPGFLLATLPYSAFRADESIALRWSSAPFQQVLPPAARRAQPPQGGEFADEAARAGRVLPQKDAPS